MKKKLLILASDFPPNVGGVATYSWELANAFTQKGYSVQVITREIGPPPPCHFQIKRIKLPQMGMLSILPLYFYLIRFLKNQEFDNVYCTLWLPEATAFWLAKKTLKIKTPYHIAVHGMEVIESSENWKKKVRSQLTFLKKRVFNEAHRVFCVSRFSKSRLMEQIPLDERKIKIVNNGANPEIFKLKTETHKSEKSILLTACRLQKNKGVDQVLKSLPKVLIAHPNLTYKIVGEGPEKPYLQELVEELNISKNVKFLGKLPQEKLIDEMNQCDLFVMLSREENQFVEGFGLVFLEAALCGTPSLGGRSGGIPDAILENETGWLVSPNDTEAISQKLISLFSSPQNLKLMGKKALDQTLNHRTWSHQVDRIIAEGDL